MKVIAAAGLTVPREDNPRRYITDAEALEIPDTPYYRRQIADGDLLIVADDPGKTTKKGEA